MTARDPSPPAVSVVIRNRNEAVHLRPVLQALAAQRLRASEVIVVDDASTDDSVAVARAGGATVLPLPGGDFTYGRALNAGLAAAGGEVCVILSAHALPLGPDFLGNCAAAFADPRVAAARCIHVGKGVDLLRWCAPELLEAGASVDEIVSKGPLASGCAIRRSVWAEVPFDERVAAAEEKTWAAAVLARGHRILSPCPAFYAYLKPVGAATARRKNFRELRAVYEATGERLGELRGGLAAALSRAARRVAVGIPRAALESAHAELVTLGLQIDFARRGARRPPQR